MLANDKPTRLPEWFRVTLPSGEDMERYKSTTSSVKGNQLHTVCEEAHCPNIGSCWERGTATFMILGDICTRACAYCAVTSGKPTQLDLKEPVRLAETALKMNLRYAVITAVNRDDLPDGGAFMFAQCIKKVRKRLPSCKIEVLIPDFEGDNSALATVIEAQPNTLNHNIETVRRIFNRVRPKGDFDQSINLLGKVKSIDRSSITKSGMMVGLVGLGETWEEIIENMEILRSVDCDLLTIGQYLRPSEKHVALAKWYTPDEFNELKQIGEKMGFKHVASGPLVRSSYHADEQHAAATSTTLQYQV